MSAQIPFDATRLDRLMDEAGMDVLIATSKHNVQYLLGGHRAFFFDYMDAMGLSRYLPVLVYAKGAPDKAAYLRPPAGKLPAGGQSVLDAGAQTNSSGSVDTMQKAIEHIRRLGRSSRRHRCRDWRSCRSMRARRCRSAFPDSEITDALFVLERHARARRRTSWRCSRSPPSR